ncbi:LysM peptidoglycan-binding domain-containing protein [Hoyosella rhizosphaerae]|uniref:LysM peptidoglycan-binding domain-containing protein n=1 Tax=Hoyosella rhizosphaerae TaxID=1755582 RepID=UPI0016695F57|nr:LysM peptidoglycan-binding domain-containing protein [Hoyosella rhizosphaerae]MBN4926356.1 LysM peptidoglycan-binding domain-containing protein [Hoyosella rhizosphaerae]
MFAVVVALMAAVPMWGLFAAPVTTSVNSAAGVVYVRSGESLSDVATRVAPTAPVDVVVASLRELNGLTNSLVQPGQPLMTPVLCLRDCR